MFKKGRELQMKAYTDIDWVRSIMDRQSTTGYCTLLRGHLITQRSKKQLLKACSSTEAKFRVTTQGICKLLWIKIVHMDLKIKFKEPMILYYDLKLSSKLSCKETRIEQFL